MDLAAHAIEQAVIGLIPLEGGTENKFANQPEGEERPETGDFDLRRFLISLLLSAGLLLVGWLAKKKNESSGINAFLSPLGAFKESAG